MKTRKKQNQKQENNPNQSWTKGSNENWLSYLRRILTYTRVNLIIAVLTLFFTALGVYIAYISLQPQQPKDDDIIVLKERINEDIQTLENKINRNSISENKDTTYYGKMINDFQNDILDYLEVFKSVYRLSLSEENANLPFEESKRIIDNVKIKRNQLAISINKLIKDIKVIELFQLNTDTTHFSALSEVKKSNIIRGFHKLDFDDSIHFENITKYVKEAKSNYNNSLNYQNNIESAISELNKMTTNNVLWYKSHYNLLELVLEANNLFEISKRHYINITPYKYIDELFNNEGLLNSKEEIDSFKRVIIKQLNET